MSTKSISSTKVQNNFGRVLDDITQNHTRYIVERRGIPQVVILGFNDFADVLSNEHARERIHTVLRELRPKYQLGQVLESQSE
jgi:PHD/YefM family antitoxin component YafN of YafNO toxin-antitoxin module